MYFVKVTYDLYVTNGNIWCFIKWAFPWEIFNYAIRHQWYNYLSKSPLIINNIFKDSTTDLETKYNLDISKMALKK